MSKVVMLGIDGLDSILVSRFIDSLPNFQRLMKESPPVRLTSIFPPDSLPAWVTISTGLNPAEHGIINFINPADKTGKVILTEVDNSLVQGKTLWDIVGKAGGKVCVLFPHPIYPAYPVNGIMACRTLKAVAKGFPIDTFPAYISKKYPISAAQLNLHQGFVSRRQFNGFIKSCRQRTLAEADLGLSILKNEECDLFFLLISSVDGVQHTFWSYYDETHPDYPGSNPYQNVIKDFYILIDEIVGKFLEAVDSDTTVLVFSDHGHGIRPTKLININELLRRQGFLVTKAKTLSSKNPLHRTEMLKGIASSLAVRFGINRLAMRLLARFPIWKRIFASPSFIDWGKTLAYTSDLSAVKSYSYGGVMLNRDNIASSDYEKIRSQIIGGLAEIRVPDSDDNLVKWICRREEIYSGECLSKYPDIVLELKDNYGLGWSANGSLVSASPMHRIQPGSHKKDSAVFLVANLKDNKCLKKEMSLMDIAPAVLDLLGVEGTLLPIKE